MKLLCVIDSLGSGGAQRQLVTLAIGFKSLGHEVFFLVYREDNFFKEDLDNHNIAIHVVFESNYFKRFLKMRSYIRNNKWDAVISFLEASNFISELSGIPFRKWKLIVGERSANPKILKSRRLKLYRWFHVFSDYIVSNSHSNINLIKRINPIISSSKYKVIYNIVEFEKWNGQNLKNVPKNEYFNLVVAASHQYLKNANGLIKAVHGLDNDLKSKLKVFWYGGGSKDSSFYEAQALIDEYSLNEIIILKGPTKDLRQVFFECDAIGLFSFYEGLPNVICEAMSMSKVIIASKISDIPLLLNADSRLLFDPNCIEDISNTLRLILSMSDNELQTIGAHNKENAQKYFDSKTIINSYLSLLKK